jgi:DNA-binding transcriptional regulator YiaG
MKPKQIQRLRRKLELTQQQLADLIGAQRVTVTRWETGMNEPRGANLKALMELEKKAKKKTRERTLT